MRQSTWQVQNLKKHQAHPRFLSNILFAFENNVDIIPWQLQVLNVIEDEMVIKDYRWQNNWLISQSNTVLEESRRQ